MSSTEGGAPATPASESGDATAVPASPARQPEGIGTVPAAPIATLPPLEETHHDIALSPRTGEPRRGPAIGISQGLLYAAAAAAGIGYARYWWVAMHVQRFFESAWAVGWLRPRPGGAGSVWLVVGLAACIATMVAAPALTAYQSWTGQSFSRRLGFVALGVSVLGIGFNPIALAAIPLTAAGIALLWHPSLTRYFAQWESIRTPAGTGPGPEAGQVFYGRLPRFR